MSIFRYNGVTFHLAKTDFSVATEQDPSNSDVLWFKYTVKVRGFISNSDGIVPGVSGGDESHEMQAALQAKLVAPRRSLFYSVGGTTILQQDAGLDAHKGPIPTLVHVRAPVAGIYPVEFEVECRQASCGQECDTGSPVVSLRWSQTESFGENWETTLTTTGLLIVRTDMRLMADSFRPLCVPPVLDDFKRVQSSYTLNEDGTQLRFTFTDKEYDRLPPYPATKADGSFSVQVTNGAKRMGQVRVRLEGQAGTSRKQLMLVAVYMAYAKLHKENEKGNEPFGRLPLLNGTFTEGMIGEIPVVEAAMTTLLPPLGGKSSVAVASSDGILPPKFMRSVGMETYGLSDGDPGIPHPIRKRILGLVSAAFRDPCACLDGIATLVHVNDLTGAELRNQSGGPDDAELRIISTDTDLTTVNDEEPYDYYECDTEWEWEEGKVLLPGSGVGENGHVGRIAQLHGFRMHMNLIWTASRTGKPPILPAYASNDPNYVPLGGKIVAKNVEMNADNTQPVYTVAGFYRYAVVDNTQANMSAATLPFFTELVSGAAEAMFGAIQSVHREGNAGGDPLKENPPPVGQDVQVEEVPGFEIQQPGFDALPPHQWLPSGFIDLSPGAGGPPVNP